MPHSSGGGSHHGGSHHHSHSHHGSSSSNNRISKTPYAGARRYRYHHRGRTQYFYTTRETGKIFDKQRLLMGLFYLPFLFGVIVMIQPVAKRQIQNYDTEIIIKDEANLLGEASELPDALNAFYEKTKIPPAVITVNNETWMRLYGGNLENYAYDRYLTEFDDEMHWLIVYSEPENPDPFDIDWYWEGMQGNDTDDILTGQITGVFNRDLQLRLNDTESSVAEDLTEAFRLVTKRVEEPGFLHNLKVIFPAIFLLLFILFHAYIMMGLYEWKYRNAEPAPEEEEYYAASDD